MLEVVEKLSKNKCRDCLFMKQNAGTHHIGCQKRSIVVIGSEHGIKNGWFSFPHDFDPIWLEDCTSFRNKDFDLNKLTNKELVNLIFKETSLYSEVSKIAKQDLVYKFLFLELNAKLKESKLTDHLDFVKENMDFFTDEKNDFNESEKRTKLLDIVKKFLYL